MFKFASVLGVVSFALAALASMRFGAVEMALRAVAGLVAGLCVGCMTYPAWRGVIGNIGGERRNRNEAS